MNKDETLVPFRGRAIALALLAEAEKQGLEANVVKTTMGGYIVPTKVAKKVDLEKVADNAGPAPYAAEPFAPVSPANEPGAADVAKDKDESEKSDEEIAAAEQAEVDRLEAEEQAAADAEEKAKADAAALEDADAAEGEPAKNAKRDVWLDYAKAKVDAEDGTWNEDDDDLGRDELIAKFGTPDPE